MNVQRPTSNVKRLILTALFAAGFGAVVMAQSLTLDSALAKAKDQATVASAQSELDDAKANLQRVLGDPLLTRPNRVQAQQRADLAQANYERALLQAQSSIVSAYTQLLEAQIQVRLAQKGLEVAAKGVEVAQIRQKNGSGTTLDLKNAQNKLDDAKTTLNRANDSLALAQSNLRSLVGPFDSVAALPTPPALPDTKTVQDLLSKSPDAIQARQRVELATLQVEVLDPSYAAQADIAAAKARADQASAGAREVERALGLQYDSLYQNLQAANRSLSVQAAAYANAKEALANDKKRLDSGLISSLAYLQTELATLQAELAAQQAQGNYYRALYSLYTGGGSGR